jgi:hypothetical protein
MTTWPNHSLQRTRLSRFGCNSRTPSAGSLRLGRWLSVKFTLLLLAVGTLLTACRHTETARQSSGNPNPCGTFTGRSGTSADTASMFFSPRTPAEVAADAEIIQHIVGAWVLDPRSNSDAYQSITFRPDGSFTAKTSGSKQLFGAWCVDRHVLFLGKPNASAPLDYPGFHVIDLVDDHHLVCGIDISVAGRMRFTR